MAVSSTVQLGRRFATMKRSVDLDPVRRFYAAAASTTSELDTLDGKNFCVTIERRASYAVMRTKTPVFTPGTPLLSDVIGGRPAFFVIDTAIERLYGAALRAYAEHHLDCTGIIAIDPFEENKTLESVGTICAAASESGLPRDGVIVGVGGGVTLDQAGLAASLFRRGIPFVRIPTTLIGIVDVGVGIKQSVNHDARKNLIGAFYPAFVNVIDPSFLGSLPARDLASGLAEIAKMAVICDRRLFRLLERYGVDLVREKFAIERYADEVIVRAQRTMMAQLCENLYEEERARPVDFGHTFSPLLEIRSSFLLSHGEAVALDMLLSSVISVELGLCASTFVARLVRLFAAVGLPITHRLLDRDLALEAMAAARKHRGTLNLVVPLAVGAVTFLQDVRDSILDAALARMVPER